MEMLTFYTGLRFTEKLTKNGQTKNVEVKNKNKNIFRIFKK